MIINDKMADIVKPQILINEEYLAAYSELPSAYNYEEIIPYVKTAELIWVESVLGTPLYEELLEQVNTNTVTDINSTLLIELYPYEAKAVVYEALPFILYHFSEVGVTKGKSENSESVDIKDMNYINTHMRAQLEYQKNHLIKWLNEHSDSFPLYRSNDCECNVINSCCNEGRLNKPNPRHQVFSTNKKRINLI